MNKFFFLFLLVVAVDVNAAQQQRCLDYFKEGTSNCTPFIEEPVRKREPRPIVIVQDASVTADIKAEAEEVEIDPIEKEVDEFIENYGKPPREYVRFNLNPTLENALIWAQKFEEMNNRTQQVSDAWGQALEILNERRDRGLDLPDYSPQRPVPEDFSQQAVPETLKWLPPKEEMREAPPVLGFAAVENGVDAGSVLLNTNVEPLSNGSLGGAVMQEKAAMGAVKVSYYFSAQCPYCKKFEPELQSLIQELGDDDIEVTCVDVTPTDRKEENIFGKIDCSWRSVVSGEMQVFDIQSTPTLLIDKGAGAEIQKVEGLVDIKSLKAFIMDGRT